MFDAAIVLANLMDASGRLNDESRLRLSVACRLVETGEADILVTSGWAYREDSDIPIAEAMAQHARQHCQLETSKILVEPHARDTVGDAVFTKRNLANRLGWKNIVVVTSNYHVDRTREIFRFVYGGDVKVIGAEVALEPGIADAEAQSLAAFRSTFHGIPPGDDDAIYQRLIHAHPFYNGDVHPALS